MKTPLTERRCEPCEGGVNALSRNAAIELLGALHEDWVLDEAGKCISRRFEFPSFARTMAFVNVVAWVATTEGHHPEMQVNYASCDVRYRTNAIDGLSDNDFICAAKIDRFAADAR